MNVIVDLIIKIFQAIFEEDRLEREKRQARVDALRARHRQAQSGEPEAIEQFFQGLFGEQAVPPKPKPQPQPRQAAKPSSMPARAAGRTETYEEHLAKFEERSHLADRRAKALDDHVSHYLGKAGPESQELHEFRLPGDSPLQQAIFAGIIFGPCKAHQKSGIIKSV